MRRFFKKHMNFWVLGSMLIVLVSMLSAYEIVRVFFTEKGEQWGHIREHLLPTYIFSSLKLLVGTLFCSSVIGVSLAWFVTIYDFKMRSWLEFAFILPISIPPYIGAYTYSGMLSYTGPIQSFLRNRFDLHLKSSFFSLSTIPGTIFIFSAFLYPYIYLAVRSFLRGQAVQWIESARLLGDSYFRIFWRLILPLIRIPLVAGATIVALDVLSDYGVSSYFGISNFSLAILKAWQNLRDMNSALRLAAFLLLAVLCIASLEKLTRKKRAMNYGSSRPKPIRRQKIRGLKAFFVSGFALLVFALSFAVPLAQILLWTFYSLGRIRTVGLGQMAFNTVLLASLSSALIVVFALIVANTRRLFPGPLTEGMARISLLGYSIPGAVIAIAVLVLFLEISPRLARGITMLVYAYVIRYFTIGYQNIESGFSRLGMSFHESARCLGSSRFKTFLRIDLPLIRPAIWAGFILSFVDITKELSMVLILRPFNFYTLATKVFEYAHDEMIPESSPASLLIILISIIPVIFLARSDKNRYEDGGVKKERGKNLPENAQ